MTCNYILTEFVAIAEEDVTYIMTEKLISYKTFKYKEAWHFQPQFTANICNEDKCNTCLKSINH